MTQNISPQAATAREQARASDGKFGTQPHDKASIDLGAQIRAQATARAADQTANIYLQNGEYTLGDEGYSMAELADARMEPAQEERFQAEARAIIDEHWDDIEALAEEERRHPEDVASDVADAHMWDPDPSMFVAHGHREDWSPARTRLYEAAMSSDSRWKDMSPWFDEERSQIYFE